MAAMGVAVNCYWSGIVKKEQNDVVYEGAQINVLPIKVLPMLDCWTKSMQPLLGPGSTYE